MLTQRGKIREQRNEELMGLLLRLRGLGIEERALLEAIENTPRDRFVPASYIDRPYLSRSYPMACGQTMTGTDQVVQTVDAMDIAPSHAVLEIGTGTGYQTALIARLAKKVVTLDRFQTLLDQAKLRLENMDIDNVLLRQADGSTDLCGVGLFDRIVANGCFSGLPKQYLDHLASGGAMIAAVGEPSEQQMLVRLTKIGSRFERQDLFPVRMSPLRRGFAQQL